MIKLRAPAADGPPVVRGSLLLSLIAALAVAGILVRAQAGSTGSSGTSQRLAAAVQEATAVSVMAELRRAGAALEARFAEAGTYAGADLAGVRVELVRADAAGYCAQSLGPGPVMHLAGPGGAPALGGC